MITDIKNNNRINNRMNNKINNKINFCLFPMLELAIIYQLQVLKLI